MPGTKEQQQVIEERGCSLLVSAAAGSGKTAVLVERIIEKISSKEAKPLSAPEAFYLGTKGGGSFFGQVGSFEEGYEFDAVVLNDASLGTALNLQMDQRMERAMYLSGTEEITAKYVGGRKIFERL